MHAKHTFVRTIVNERARIDKAHSTISFFH